MEFNSQHTYQSSTIARTPLLSGKPSKHKNARAEIFETCCCCYFSCCFDIYCSDGHKDSKKEFIQALLTRDSDPWFENLKHWLNYKLPNWSTLFPIYWKNLKAVVEWRFKERLKFVFRNKKWLLGYLRDCCVNILEFLHLFIRTRV